MKQNTGLKVGLSFVVVGLGLGVFNARAATIFAESSTNAYTVSSTDLLQRYRGDVNTTINMYERGSIELLTDGSAAPANEKSTFGIANGTLTYVLDTTYCPAGFTVTEVNTYTGWKDLGRVNQKYTVSFRKVGASVFSDAVAVDYIGTNTQTCVKITELNLAGVDAVRFVFPEQQNSGVGYKEFDVIGEAPGLTYSVTGERGSVAYTVSNTDLLQSNLGSVTDAIRLFNEPGYTSGTSSLLTDGLFGPASSGETCAIANGTLTYTLNTDDHPAGYEVATVNSYTGWNDAGRVNQNYTMSFRKIGSAEFRNAVAVNYAGGASQTHVAADGLGLTGVTAVRFVFPNQQNSGVGYKELDVIGSAPAYFDVTRLSSGNKVITNSAAASVRIVEGAGESGSIALEAANNTIRTLTQGVTAGVAVVDPAGGVLAADGIFSQAGAGGLTLAQGVLTAASQTRLAFDNRSVNPIAINAVITDSRDVAIDLVKTGAGTLKLGSANTYSGVTVFEGGVIDVASVSNYGEPGALGLRLRTQDRSREVGLLFHGGTLRYSGSTPQRTDRSIRINAENAADFPGGAVIDASGSVPAATLSFLAPDSPDFFENPGSRYLALIGSNTGDNTFAMVVRETGGATRVIKRGEGTWVLNGANIYSGGTMIEGGTLKSSAVGSGVVRINSGATWEAGVVDLTIAGLEGSGTVHCVRGAVTTGGDGAAMISTNKNYELLLDFGNAGGATVNNVVFDSVGTSGPGWALSNTGYMFNEAVAMNGYEQLVSDFCYSGNPGVLTFNNLTVGRIYNIMLYTKIGIWQSRPQDATFTNGADSHQLLGTEPGGVGYYSYRFLATDATATITMAPHRANDSFHWYGASLAIEQPAALTVGDASDRTFAGQIRGAAGLSKQGSGRLTLSGTSTYTGATTVHAGSLEIVAGDTLPTTTSVEIKTGATMVLNNVDAQVVAGLSFDGVPQYCGTWGGPESAATYKHSLFTGTGVLHVVAGPGAPGTVMLLQ
ncbi:MAG: autotransporter-associated beta strand repeat-containing protein [Kiritimatiellae bacterium]|nr:autotransporter-associated beta strand repeat-containing protein [Kiritimatiellia bacterium]